MISRMGKLKAENFRSFTRERLFQTRGGQPYWFVDHILNASCLEGTLANNHLYSKNE